MPLASALEVLGSASRSGSTQSHTFSSPAVKSIRTSRNALFAAEIPESSISPLLSWIPQFVLQGDRRGAAIFVRSELSGLGPEISDLARQDKLFRDTVVYLTCVHELGHGLGLEHTANYDDIMFFFGYGGDVLNYFLRYRNQLEVREDIAQNWGLSDADIATLRGLYP